MDHAKRHVIRLSTEAFNASGHFLYGQRFSSRLSRAIGVDQSLIRRWASGDRLCSERFSRKLVELVHARRGQRTELELVVFANYVAKLPVELQAVALALADPEFAKRVPESA